MEGKLIVNQLCKSFGSGESSSVELITDTATGKTEFVIRKTISEHYPVTDYEKVMRLYENLNRGGGRRIWLLEDLTK